MKISIFDMATGQILRVVQCPDADVALQFDPASQDYIEGEYPDDQFYIVALEPVPIPPRPSLNHVFDYTTKQWVDPRTTETQWPVVRSQRNALLSSSDWTQLPDVPLDTKEAWAAYRQALRDVTLQPDPFAISWPATPGV